MSAATHVDRGRWPLLLSLPAEDPERRTALEHAAACAGCESDRHLGAGLLETLTRLPQVPPPVAAALERAALPVREALAAEGTVRRLAKSAESFAAIGAFGLVLALATQWNVSGWWPPLVLLGAALLVPWFVNRFGGWAPLVLAGVSTAFAISRAADSHMANHLDGFGCAGMEALAMVLPLVALAVVARRRELVFGSLAYAGAAAAGALAGQAALFLTCPSHDLSHLLVLHSGVVLIAAMFGAGVPRLIPSLAR